MAFRSYLESWRQQQPLSLVLRVVSESVLLTFIAALVLTISGAMSFQLPLQKDTLFIVFLIIIPLVETVLFFLPVKILGNIAGIRTEILQIITYIFIVILYLVFYPSLLILCGILGGIYFVVCFYHSAHESLIFSVFNTFIARILYFSVIVGFISLISLNGNNLFQFPGKTHSGYIFMKNTSPSMNPAVQPGELLVVRAAYYRHQPVSFGDIALIQYDQMYPEPLLKRVVGLPGDTVSLSQGRLVLNSAAQPEPYVDQSNRGHPLSRSISKQVVPEGHIFVLGDNRDNSYDSRYWGPLPDSVLVGKAQYILWSEEWSRVGQIQHADGVNK